VRVLFQVIKFVRINPFLAELRNDLRNQTQMAVTSTANQPTNQPTTKPPNLTNHPSKQPPKQPPNPAQPSNHPTNPSKYSYHSSGNVTSQIIDIDKRSCETDQLISNPEILECDEEKRREDNAGNHLHAPPTALQKEQTKAQMHTHAHRHIATDVRQKQRVRMTKI
jgi:hypothetical protein